MRKPRELTTSEKKAIERVRKAFKGFPESLQIFDFSGSLLIVDFNTKQIFDGIDGVHSDGGDPGTVEENGGEFLNL